MYTWKLKLLDDIKSLKGSNSIEIKLICSDEIYHKEDENFVKIKFNNFFYVKIFDRKNDNIEYELNETKRTSSIKYEDYIKVFKFLEENEKELNVIYNNIFTN